MLIFDVRLPKGVLCSGMDSIFPFLTPFEFYAALAIGLCGGFVKGVVGFALPLVLISGLTTFMAPELALAGLILPTVLANAFQALRQGPQAALRSIRLFWVFLVCGGVMLVLSAQMVRLVPATVQGFDDQQQRNVSRSSAGSKRAAIVKTKKQNKTSLVGPT